MEEHTLYDAMTVGIIWLWTQNNINAWPYIRFNGMAVNSGHHKDPVGYKNCTRYSDVMLNAMELDHRRMANRHQPQRTSSTCSTYPGFRNTSLNSAHVIQAEDPPSYTEVCGNIVDNVQSYTGANRDMRSNDYIDSSCNHSNSNHEQQDAPPYCEIDRYEEEDLTNSVVRQMNVFFLQMTSPHLRVLT
mgnify:CR=1 FL=1